MDRALELGLPQVVSAPFQESMQTPMMSMVAFMPQIYRGRTRRERHEELIAFAIRGGIHQARIAHEYASSCNGRRHGPIHMNILWEMGGAEQVLTGILEGARGLIQGVTCGAGMPYRIAQICTQYQVYYYPIVSSARAFRALWKRAYCRFSEWLGGVVYEDPWRAGGHNGLSNSEDAHSPEPPMPRVIDLRREMKSHGLDSIPIVMAGGVWWLIEWENWLDNPDVGPIAFQFGTRPLLTEESPISDSWKKRLLTLKVGDVVLNRFSPTGFWSSAVNNRFLKDLAARAKRQISYSLKKLGEYSEPLAIGGRGRIVYVTAKAKEAAIRWIQQGFTEGLKTPESTLIFENPDQARRIKRDQVECMGCLSACQFSNWLEKTPYNTGQKADPRSYCIQKTLQDISHGGLVEQQLIFAGHNAFRFSSDPFYANGFIPNVRQLVERIASGH